MESTGVNKCVYRKFVNTFGKEINLQFWTPRKFENRRSYRDNASVLWPATVPENPDVVEYLSSEGRSLERFQPRVVSRNPISPFATESGRQLLEEEFLRAGARIINSHNEVRPALKPLGFSSFEPGFGSLVAFYRNCPNNTPLALWWGLGGWYPRYAGNPTKGSGSAMVLVETTSMAINSRIREYRRDESAVF